MRRRLVWLLLLVPLVAPMGALALATLQADPSSVAFSRRCARSTAAPSSVTVRNDGDPEAVDVVVSVSPSTMASIFPLGGTRSVGTLDPDEAFTFSVGFVPVAAGTAKATAVVSYAAASTPPAAAPSKSKSPSPSPSPTDTPSPTPTPTPTPTYLPKTETVPLSGSAYTRFIATSPTSITFGSIRLRQRAAAKTIQVLNDGSSALTVSSISIEGPDARDFSVSPVAAATITESKPLSLSLRFTARSLGAKHASLVLRSDSCRDPTLRVPLAAVVVEPDVFVDPPEVIFEPTEVGRATESRRVLVVNQGGSPLVVRSVEIPDSEEFTLRRQPLLPVEIAPGDELELAIVFSPRQAGQREASLHVESSDPNAPSLDARLAGRGDPDADAQEVPSIEPSPSPTTIDGERVAIGDYGAEILVLIATVGFFTLLVLVRRLRGRPE